MGAPTRRAEGVLRFTFAARDLIKLIEAKETWMKFALAIAALALCGSAFAATGPAHAHGVVNTVKQDAHQIGSSFRHDMHSIARADKFRQEEAADQRHMRASTTAMGAGRDNGRLSSSRQARMDAAYANWERSRR